MEWRDRAGRYGFPLFIVVAIAAGAVMLVALSHRTPPTEPAAQPYRASATQTAAVAAPTSAGPTSAGPTSAVRASPSAPPPTAPVRLAVFGGGVTNGNSPDFVAKKLGDTSWVDYVTGSGVDFVGGWADSGASSQGIAAAARPISADVVVIDVGVEDQLRGTSFSDTAANIDKLVKTTNTPKVILLSAAPFESAPGAAGMVNKQLQQLGNDRGWTFVDAAAGVRDGNAYKNGMSDDGKQPNATGAKVIGAAVRAAILPR